MSSTRKGKQPAASSQQEDLAEFQDLPPELLAEIATHLPTSALAQFSLLNPTTRNEGKKAFADLIDLIKFMYELSVFPNNSATTPQEILKRKPHLRFEKNQAEYYLSIAKKYYVHENSMRERPQSEDELRWYTLDRFKGLFQRIELSKTFDMEKADFDRADTLHNAILACRGECEEKILSGEQRDPAIWKLLKIIDDVERVISPDNAVNYEAAPRLIDYKNINAKLDRVIDIYFDQLRPMAEISYIRKVKKLHDYLVSEPSTSSQSTPHSRR